MDPENDPWPWAETESAYACMKFTEEEHWMNVDNNNNKAAEGDVVSEDTPGKSSNINDGASAAGNDDNEKTKDESHETEKKNKKSTIKKVKNKAKRDSRVQFDESSSKVTENDGESKHRKWSLFEKKGKNKKNVADEGDGEGVDTSKTDSATSTADSATDEPVKSECSSEVEVQTDASSAEDLSQTPSRRGKKKLFGKVSHLGHLFSKHKKSESEHSGNDLAASEKEGSKIGITEHETEPGETMQGFDAFVESEINRFKAEKAMEAETPVPKSTKSQDNPVKQKKRRRSSFWFGKHKKDEGTHKEDQKDNGDGEETPGLLQKKLNDLSQRLSAFDEEIKGKSEALQQAEKHRKDMSSEIEKLKAQLEDNQRELHLCSSARDILHVTAVETSKELEQAEEVVCRLKRSNGDLQFDAQEDRYFIQQLKEELAAKERDCEQYKKMLEDNQKRVSRSIALYLRQSNESLKNRSLTPKRKGSKFNDEEVLKNLKQEKNRFAEQVELLSSHNISLEMHIDSLEKRLDDLMKLIGLYEAVGIQLELQDIKYCDLNREAQKYLAFYRAHDGSKNILNREQNTSVNNFSCWEDSLDRLQEAACETVSHQPDSAVDDTSSSCLVDENLPVASSTPKKQRSASVHNHPEENGKRQKSVARRKSHHDVEELANQDKSPVCVDFNISANNAGIKNPSASSLPLRRTAAASDIRPDESDSDIPCQSSAAISSLPSSTAMGDASSCHNLRSILKNNTRKY